MTSLPPLGPPGARVIRSCCSLPAQRLGPWCGGHTMPRRGAASVLLLLLLLLGAGERQRSSLGSG